MDDKEQIILQLIFVLLAAIFGGIGGAYIQNQLSIESLESELVIIDMHLEEKENTQVLNKLPLNISIKGYDGNEINYSFLEVNISIVNSVYSKYPLKIIDSKLDFKGGNEKTSSNILEYNLDNINYTMVMGETTMIFRHLSSEPIYPSEQGRIIHYALLPFEGDHNLTASLDILYYDPMIDKTKYKNDEVFALQISNGKLEKITRLKEYVTVTGYTIEDYEFGIHG